MKKTLTTLLLLASLPAIGLAEPNEAKKTDAPQPAKTEKADNKEKAEKAEKDQKADKAERAVKPKKPDTKKKGNEAKKAEAKKPAKEASKPKAQKPAAPQSAKPSAPAAKLPEILADFERRLLIHHRAIQKLIQEGKQEEARQKIGELHKQLADQYRSGKADTNRPAQVKKPVTHRRAVVVVKKTPQAEAKRHGDKAGKADCEKCDKQKGRDGKCEECPKKKGGKCEKCDKQKGRDGKCEECAKKKGDKCEKCDAKPHGDRGHGKKAEHLSEAAKHLKAAGLDDSAKRLQAEAERIRRYQEQEKKADNRQDIGTRLDNVEKAIARMQVQLKAMSSLLMKEKDKR